MVNMSKDDKCEFYSIKEFATKLGVHSNTVRRAIKNGRINAFRVGKGEKATFRIPKSEVNRIAMFDLKEIVDKMVDERLKAGNG